MKRINLEIMTPDRSFYNDEVDSVTVNTTTGEMGIMHGTFPLVATLESGIIRIYKNNKFTEAINGSGFVEVNGGNAVIFVQSCLWPHEIDYKTIDEEISQMQDMLKKKQSLYEYRMTKAQLQMQFVKLRIKSHTGD